MRVQGFGFRAFNWGVSSETVFLLSYGSLGVLSCREKRASPRTHVVLELGVLRCLHSVYPGSRRPTASTDFEKLWIRRPSSRQSDIGFRGFRVMWLYIPIPQACLRPVNHKSSRRENSDTILAGPGSWGTPWNTQICGFGQHPL